MEDINRPNRRENNIRNTKGEYLTTHTKQASIRKVDIVLDGTFLAGV